MKIRIIDIAKKSGVSPGTVDRIIHKRGRVSKKASEKVQKAIEELGYEPDLLARNLALKKELKFVCLLPDYKDTPYWARPYSGIMRAAEELSSFKIKIKTILFSITTAGFKKACNEVLNAKADGVVIAPVFHKEAKDLCQQLTDTNIPFIQINIYQPETHPLSFVGQNPLSAGSVVASLCQMTIKKQDEILITYISKQEQEYTHHNDRIKGFTDFFKHLDKTPLIHHLHITIHDSNTSYEELLLQQLNNNPNIKIIYIPNSRAYRIASILRKNNITDKIVIGFDTLDENVKLLKDGYIDILIGQQSKTQGFNAVMSLFNALFRKDEINKLNYLPIDILNKENVDFYEGY